MPSDRGKARARRGGAGLAVQGDCATLEAAYLELLALLDPDLCSDSVSESRPAQQRDPLLFGQLGDGPLLQLQQRACVICGDTATTGVTSLGSERNRLLDMRVTPCSRCSGMENR